MVAYPLLPWMTSFVAMVDSWHVDSSPSLAGQ
jgi:hypothetical protein